jgi:hypothetical protein
LRSWRPLDVRIGIDFDNTIVSYDTLFHRVALERGLIPISVPANKISVREYLRERDSEDQWTQLQGYVYGARMSEAEAYPGAIEFFSWARERNIQPVIVSHKTRYPFLGERYDLHDAARGWVQKILIERSPQLIDAQAVYFELTKQEKNRADRCTRARLLHRRSSRDPARRWIPDAHHAHPVRHRQPGMRIPGLSPARAGRPFSATSKTGGRRSPERSCRLAARRFRHRRGRRATVCLCDGGQQSRVPGSGRW